MFAPPLPHQHHLAVGGSPHISLVPLKVSSSSRTLEMILVIPDLIEIQQNGIRNLLQEALSSVTVLLSSDRFKLHLHLRLRLPVNANATELSL